MYVDTAQRYLATLPFPVRFPAPFAVTTLRRPRIHFRGAGRQKKKKKTVQLI